MPHIRSRFLLATLIAVGTLLAGAAPLPAVQFPDKNLEAALRYYILEKRNKPDELTDDDLKKIFVLEAKGKMIKDLTGLEKCPNLALINFAKNEVADITALKGLKSLQSLDLSDNKITDVTALTELVGLQYLDLTNNQIADAKPLATLVKLSMLDLSGNKVTDVTPLAALAKISSLYLPRNGLTDIKPLAGLTGVSILKLSDNQIADIAPLEKMNNLRMLFLERNKITDLAPLVNSCKADAEKEKRFAPYLRLYLKENPLSDPAKAEQLPALQKAGVRIDPEKS